MEKPTPANPGIWDRHLNPLQPDPLFAVDQAHQALTRHGVPKAVGFSSAPMTLVERIEWLAKQATAKPAEEVRDWLDLEELRNIANRRSDDQNEFLDCAPRVQAMARWILRVTGEQ